MRRSIETATLRFTLVIGVVLGIVSAGSALAQDAILGFDGSAAPGEIFIRDGGDPPVFVEGRLGQAISFDERAVVALPFDADPRRHPQLSVSLWLKIDTNAAGAPWIFRTDGRNLPAMRLRNRYLTVGIRAADGTGNLEAPAQLPIDQWVHVVKVWDYDASARSVRIHVGGEEFVFSDLEMDVAGGDVLPQSPISAPGSAATAEKQRYVFIGASNFKTYNNAARGVSIDDVRIFTRALSTDEVTALASNEAAVGTPPLPNDADDAGLIPVELPSVAGSTSPQPTPTAPAELAEGPAPDMTEIGNAATTQRETTPRPLPGSPQYYGPDIDREDLPDTDSASPPATQYESDEAALAAAQESARRRAEEERLATEAEPQDARQTTARPVLGYDGQILLLSGVSGSEGSYSDRIVFTDRQGFVHGFRTEEENNRPCRVRIIGTTLNNRQETIHQGVDHCEIAGVAGALSNPLATRLETPITAIQICTPGFNNRRVKGLQARHRDINADGSLSSSYETEIKFEQTNCLIWQQWVSCPSPSIAVGATFYFQARSGLFRNDVLTGVELVCSEVTLQ